MGNSLVAVDAGFFAAGQKLLVGLGGSVALFGEIHEVEVVAVSALEGVVCLEPGPLVPGQCASMGKELLACIDSAENFPPDFLRRLHLAGNLVRPSVWHVAVRASGANTGAIGVMNGAFQVLEHVVPHFVTGNAKKLRIGGLQHRIERTPEDDAGDEIA